MANAGHPRLAMSAPADAAMPACSHNGRDLPSWSWRRASYDRQREHGATHYQALRALANRLVGILHGCLGHQTLYSENRAWHTDDDANQPRRLTHSNRGMSSWR